ncbi:MAG: HlyD family efflux transporter periplasmic adaptor subunit [Anaerolineales bacterium]|nr:HlyD family efflux transporter periplasmic adaptor subunit [Anaerolineales bacterium]
MKQIQSRVWFLGLIGSMLVLLAACSGQADPLAPESQPSPTPLPTPIIPEKSTYVVQLGSVVRTLEFTGRASPVKEQELYFQADGYVSDVFVERGDWVNGGDLLVQLDISSLDSQLEQLKISLETAKNNLEEAELDLADSLVQAQRTLENAQAQLEKAENIDNPLTRLNANIALEDAREAVTNAEEAYAVAWEPARDWELQMTKPSCLTGQGGNVACTGTPLADKLESERESTVNNLAETKQSLTIAQLEYNQTIANMNLDYESMLQEIESAELAIEQLERGVDPQLELDIQQVELEVKDVEREIAGAQIYAPFDGEILSISISEGDSASAYTAVMVLADPGELEFTAELGSEDLSEMSINQAAEITLRNRPEDTLSGYVRQLPYPYGGGTTGLEDDDTAVHIALDSKAGVELGELATVVILLEEKTDVLWLPPAAIRSYQGRYFVVIQLDDGQKRADVLLGAVTDDRVEILQGVEEGQIIVGE